MGKLRKAAHGEEYDRLLREPGRWSPPEAHIFRMQKSMMVHIGLSFRGEQGRSYASLMYCFN